MRRKRREHELERELRSYLEAEAEERRQSGLTPDQARSAALRSLGNTTAIKEEVRMNWGWMSLERLRQDTRYALRTFRRTPAFTAVAVLSLALGIGANSAIFSLIDAVMLSSLPVAHPEELALLKWVSRTWPGGVTQTGYADMDKSGRSTSPSFPYPAFEQFRTQKDLFASVFAVDPIGKVNVIAGGEASLANGELVTGEYFSGLGVRAILGRMLAPADEDASAPRVAVISHDYWIRRFGGESSVIGKIILINQAPFTIVGVAPPEFAGIQPGRAAELWVSTADEAVFTPFGYRDPARRGLLKASNHWWIMVMARRKPGASDRQATARLTVLFRRLASAAAGASVKPEDLPEVVFAPAGQGLEGLRQRFSKPLFLLMAVVGMVLLIACTNLASLLLSRATARRAEIGVRLAIGASRKRLIRQLLTESVLLAGLGGALGLLLAYWGSRSLVLLLSSGGEPVALHPQLHAPVLAFTAAVSILTGILSGVAPALRATRVDISAAARAHGPGEGRLGVRRLLLAAQVALSLVLLAGTGLFVRTFMNLENQSLGFHREGVLLFAVDPSQNGYKEARLLNLYAQLLERARAVPGVRMASCSTTPLVSGTKSQSDFTIDGQTPKPGQRMSLWWNVVGPDFFETMGIGRLLGRGIEARDTENSARVVVVNETMARQYFGGENPIGRRIRFTRFGAGKDYEIVGVVRDARYEKLRGDYPPTGYFAYTQDPSPLGRMYFELRAAGDPSALIRAVRSAVHEVEPNLPLFDVKTQSQQIDETLLQERLFARLSSFFGLLAVLLVCIGLHGAVAYALARRTREIGIRMAMGAPRRQVVWMMLRESLALVVLGIGAGIPLALLVLRLVGGFLYGLTPGDPLTLAAAAVAMLVVATLAGLLPARRAARLDPMLALRYE